MVFFNVYIKEAHPTDGWRMQSNDMAGIRFRQPKDFAERFGVAEQCSIRLDMKSPVLIDNIANTTCEDYAAFPDRLYIIDMDGKVSYKGGRGPFGYKPKEMEQSLLLLMMEAQIKSRQKTASTEKKTLTNEKTPTDAKSRKSKPVEPPTPPSPKPPSAKKPKTTEPESTKPQAKSTSPKKAESVKPGNATPKKAKPKSDKKPSEPKGKKQKLQINKIVGGN